MEIEFEFLKQKSQTYLHNIFVPSGTLTAKISESIVSVRCTLLFGAMGCFSGSSDSNSKSMANAGPNFISGASSVNTFPLYVKLNKPIKSFLA